ncbi:MAG: hypothetical protein OQK75_13535 [Gammaproteobacteria bacterium]|nr:hypothetical protein [Gammaproteobacteria bacterium]MCW8988681.1 hypothetical protein [Gammaproteobacteria bacterium]MCW9031180.1 hypothetical protein [Gammaproteobacteria bacterium]
MRYRDTGDYQNLGVPVDDNLVFFSILLGIVLAVAFIVVGIRVKRYWMVIWGTGLVFASLSYFVMRMLGYF